MNPGQLTKHIHSIYREDCPQVFEFHGNWGSLAVSRNLHMGFDPLETENHICIVIGGPVLKFTSNRFLAGEDRVYGTRELLKRWSIGQTIRWDEDLSGPFVWLKLDKKKRQLEVVTDLMSFIPVYQSGQSHTKVIGTHVDMVARVAECEDVQDPVSLADFVLHSVVTYPHTLYPGIKQISPASLHHWALADGVTYQTQAYWLPRAESRYQSLDEAADDLRAGMQSYVNAVCEEMDRVAIFLSGGEDSRTVLGMVPRTCERDAVIFLDVMNREGRVAQAAARAYGAHFKMYPRGKLWYFDMLPACSDLVGRSAQYKHVHSYGFLKLAKLNGYRAVFGGFLSDTLVKAYHVRRKYVFNRFPFLPYLKAKDQKKRSLDKVSIVHSGVLAELRARTDEHLEFVRSIRGWESAYEWFNLWPISMHSDMPFLYGNRRLFASYEPFMANSSVKVTAAVPQAWRMNRRLFQKMAQPLLKPSKYLLHADGWMPYYSWHMNILIHGIVWLRRRIEDKLGLTKGNQGPWNDWSVIFESAEWRNGVNNIVGSGRCPEELFSVPLDDLFNESYLDISQKVNLMQIAYQWCSWSTGDTYWRTSNASVLPKI